MKKINKMLPAFVLSFLLTMSKVVLPAQAQGQASLSVRVENGQNIMTNQNTKLIFHATDTNGNPLQGVHQVTLDNYVGSGIVTDGLVLWLDGADAPTGDRKWLDRSGNGHVMTLSDRVTYDNERKAYRFPSGTNAKGVTDELHYHNSYELTVEFIDADGSLTTTNTSYLMFSGNDLQKVGSWALFRNADQFLRFYGSYSVHSTGIKRSEFTTEAGQAASYTITHDRKQEIDDVNTFYKNGQKIEKITPYDRIDLSNSPLADYPLTINGITHMGGVNLSSLRIYNRKLSEAEILQNQKADALRFSIGGQANKENYGYFENLPLDGKAVTVELNFTDGQAEATLNLSKSGAYNLQFRMMTDDGNLIIGGIPIGSNDAGGAAISDLLAKDASGNIIASGQVAADSGYTERQAPSLAVEFTSGTPNVAKYKWYRSETMSYLGAELCAETNENNWKLPVGYPLGNYHFYAIVTVNNGGKEVSTISPLTSVRIGGGNLSIFANGNTEGSDENGRIANTYIYRNSTLNAGNGEQSLWQYYGLNEAGNLDLPYQLGLLDDAGLKEKKNYPNFGAAYWEFTGNGMPYLKTLYTNSEDYRDHYSEIDTPNWSEQEEVTAEGLMSQSTMEARLMLMVSDMTEIMPEFEVVSSGADSVNLEFAEVNELVDVTLIAEDEILYRGKLDAPVMTFGYDYNSELTIILSSEYSEQTKEMKISAEQLRCSIMVYGDHYYYLTGDGLMSNQGYLAKDIVHLAEGKAMNAQGEVLDLESLEKAEALELGQRTEVRPLYQSLTDGTTIRVFENFSMVDDAVRDLKLYDKKNHLFAVDPRLPIDSTHVLVDRYLGKNYLTVLGDDGMLQNLQTEIKVPEDFMNAGIVEMTSTLATEKPWVLVRYSNQNVDGFNYLTGERLDLERGEFEPTFLEFAGNFFSSKKEPILGSLRDGYIQIVELEEKLRVDPNLSELLYATKGNGETSSPSGKGEVTEKEEISELEGTDGVSSQENSGAEQDGEASSGLSTQNGNGAVTEDGEISQGEGQITEGGMVAQQQAVEFVTYYDAGTRSYQLIEKRSLLNRANEEVKTLQELAQQQGNLDLVNRLQNVAKPMQKNMNLNGIGLFALTVSGILALLVALLLRQKSKQKQR